MKRWQIGVESWLTAGSIRIQKWSYSAAHNQASELVVVFEAGNFSIGNIREEDGRGIIDLTLQADNPVFARVGGVLSINIKTLDSIRAEVEAVLHVKQFHTSYEDAAAAEMQEKMENK